MNVFENVMLTSDSNFVPSKFVVMACTVGETLEDSHCWIRRVSYGISTEADLNDYYDTNDRTLLKGTLGEYQVVTLKEIQPYYRRVFIKETNVDIG